MPRTNTELKPWDGCTERQRRLSMPLPDLPVRALKRDQAILEGYKPFAGFFLQHEYPMLNGFIRDLEAAKREYCFVRDLKHAKGIELFAKDGNTNRIVTESPEEIRTQEGTQAMASHKNSSGPKLTEGVHETPARESGIRESQGDLASGEIGA